MIVIKLKNNKIKRRTNKKLDDALRCFVRPRIKESKTFKRAYDAVNESATLLTPLFLSKPGFQR